MQLYCKNTLTVLAISVLLVCVLQTAPGAKAHCTETQLKQKAKEICGTFFFLIPPCQPIAEHVLQEFSLICKSSDKDTKSTTTSDPQESTTG